MTNRCKCDKKESFTLNFCAHEMLRALNLVIMKNAPDEKRKVVKKKTTFHMRETCYLLRGKAEIKIQ